MMQEKECTDIWRRYQAGKDHHNRTNMYTQAEKCHRFYEGDQWHGLQAGDEELPIRTQNIRSCRMRLRCAMRRIRRTFRTMRRMKRSLICRMKQCWP